MTERKRFTEDFIEYVSEFSTSPKNLVQWSALFSIASVLSRNVVLKAGSWNIYPNLWMILLGPSSAYKSTALSTGRRLVEQVNRDVHLPTEFSSEQLMIELQKRPTSAMVYDEMQSLFSICSKRYNQGVAGMLTTLYSCRDGFTRTTKADKQVTVPPMYLCIGGASTPEWIVASMKDRDYDFASGFLGRFSFVVAKPDDRPFIPFPPPADKMKEKMLISRLVEMSRLNAEAHMTDDAEAIYSEWATDFNARILMREANKDSSVNLLVKIRDQICLKLCLLSAIDCGNFPHILPSDVRFAKELVNVLEMSASKISEMISGTNYQKEQKKIAYTIFKAGELTIRELSQKTKITGKYLQQHLDDLETTGDVSVDQYQSKTKPGRRIKWVGGLLDD